MAPSLRLGSILRGLRYRKTAFPMGTGNTLTAWAVCSLGAAGSQAYARMLSYGNPLDYNSVGSFFFGQSASSGNLAYSAIMSGGHVGKHSASGVAPIRLSPSMPGPLCSTSTGFPKARVR